MEIHQILPDIRKGDAIGNETLLIRDILREWGYNSEIYAQNIHPEIDAFHYIDYKKISSAGNILIYHYSIGSVISDFIKCLPDRIVIIYHNQTPEKYFWGVNDYIAGLLRKGKKDLKEFSKITRLGLCDSEFNRSELQDLGFPRTGLLPPVIDFKKYSLKNEKIFRLFDDQKINLLFVGRIAPNKRQDEIIKVFYYFKHIHHDSRLFLIGSSEGFEDYYQKLKEMIGQLSLTDVVIPGNVDDSDLNSYYSVADVFLCMSEHEGFCVPLVECMYFGIPIIANNATAIPDTLRDSGILINNKNYCEIAELINLILIDEKLRERLIKEQRETLKNYGYEKTKEKLKHYINQILLEINHDK
jgi:glycosyltransferase involved in cell wall biosynthesis